ncbi:unnamed protein product, partial [Didymodactylos carnosus]
NTGRPSCPRYKNNTCLTMINSNNTTRRKDGRICCRKGCKCVANSRRDCNNSSTDGRDTNIQTDVNNCGACGNKCSPANGKPGCSFGTCQIQTCDAGFGDCDRNVSNGCETNIQTDVNNCGACCKKCSPANGKPGCSSGTCQVQTCDAGFGDCDGIASNGCETNVQTDVNNCGFCFKQCTADNNTAQCCSGICLNKTCDAGFGDCDRNVSNGCETNIQTDVNNCGACGKKCSPANGKPGCSSGTCQVQTCDAGFGDCDRNVSNGCETNIQTDVNNCGACGHICSPANESYDGHKRVSRELLMAKTRLRLTRIFEAQESRRIHGETVHSHAL